ncbi:MAG: hypothetical protein OHK0046_36830 [Anaerolineae bacterium]
MNKWKYTHKYMHDYISSGQAMTDSPDPKLTPKAQALLDVLKEMDGWMGRADLAARLNKKALNKWDIVLLSKLHDAGLIEMRQIPHHGPIGYEWQYRAVSHG